MTVRRHSIGKGARFDVLTGRWLPPIDESGSVILLGPSNPVGLVVRAPAKRKVRFTFLIDGKDRQTLSAFQRPNGDLLIALAHAEKFEGEIPILYQRYSVHRSMEADPPLVTIKHTLGLAGGQELDSAQARLRGTGELRAMLFGRALPNLADDLFTMTKKAGDLAVRLHPNDIVDKGTPLQLVFVTGPGDVNDAFRPLGLPITTVQFDHFNLVIVVGFLYLPAAHLGQLVHIMTSAVRYNKSPISNEVICDLTMLSTKELNNEAGQSVAGLFASLIKAHIQSASQLPDSEQAVAALLRMQPAVSSAPVGYPQNFPSEVVW